MNVLVNTHGYNYTYTSYNVHETSAITLKIKANMDGLIGLLPDVKTSFLDEQFYEIVIGGWSNTKTVVRKGGDFGRNNAEVDKASGFLNETEFRQFWVSWENNVIAVGYGDIIGKDVIFSYDDSSAPYEINFLAFSSYAQNKGQFIYSSGNYGWR